MIQNWLCCHELLLWQAILNITSKPAVFSQETKWNCPSTTRNSTYRFTCFHSNWRNCMIANIHYFYFSSYFRPFIYFSLSLFCFFFFLRHILKELLPLKTLDLRALLRKSVLKRRKGTKSARFAFLGIGFPQIVSKKG